MYQKTESVLRIQSAETGKGIFLVSRPVGTHTNIGAKLIFRRCGEKYVLIEVHFLRGGGQAHASFPGRE